MESEKQIAKYLHNLPAIVEQLQDCDYQCEGGPLNNNVAFIALKQMAATEMHGFMCDGCGRYHRKSAYCIAQNVQGHDVTFTCSCGKTKLFKGGK